MIFVSQKMQIFPRLFVVLLRGSADTWLDQGRRIKSSSTEGLSCMEAAVLD
jgi:hypothetical protein